MQDQVSANSVHRIQPLKLLQPVRSVSAAAVGSSGINNPMEMVLEPVSVSSPLFECLCIPFSVIYFAKTAFAWRAVFGLQKGVLIKLVVRELFIMLL